jgi:uncharacterized protein YjbI with pentapeptide repeats
MSKLWNLTFASLGFVSLLCLSVSNAAASTIVPGSSIQFEIHSGERHRGDTLDGIDLSFGSFASSNLRDATLIGGIFVQTNFTDTNLRDADLSNADLTDAIFSSGTNLKDANLSGASLIGIDLTGVNTATANFSGATYDSTSILPFDPIAAGMVVIPEQSPMTLMLLGLVLLAATKRFEPQDEALVPLAA